VLIEEDKEAANIVQNNGKTIEVGSPNDRYQKGFKDIIDRNFINIKDEKECPKTQIIVIVSHSDGMNPFLNFFEQKEIISRVWYCCTVAIDLTKLNDSYNINHFSILQKKSMNQS
jgi:hypothetical protein